MPKSYTSISKNHTLALLGRIRKAADGFREAIELTVNDRTVHISDNRGRIALDMVNAAENTLFSYDRNGFAKRLHLSTADQRRMLVMVDEVLSGKREAIQFQLTRNCDAIKEIFSNEIFGLHPTEKKP